MNKLLITLLSALVLTGCTNSADFTKGSNQLTQQGYTDIKSTGYSYWCCDEKDTFSEGFVCKDRNGNQVSGCICSGFMKGVTIRFQ